MLLKEILLLLNSSAAIHILLVLSVMKRLQIIHRSFGTRKNGIRLLFFADHAAISSLFKNIWTARITVQSVIQPLIQAVKTIIICTSALKTFSLHAFWEKNIKEEEFMLKKLIKKAIKYAPIVYPIVKKMLNKRKNGGRTNY